MYISNVLIGKRTPKPELRLRCETKWQCYFLVSLFYIYIGKITSEYTTATPFRTCSATAASGVPLAINTFDIIAQYYGSEPILEALEAKVVVFLVFRIPALLQRCFHGFDITRSKLYAFI